MPRTLKVFFRDAPKANLEKSSSTKKPTNSEAQFPQTRTNTIDTDLLKDILPDSYLLSPVTEKSRNPFKRTQRMVVIEKRGGNEPPLTDAEKFPLSKIKILGFVSKGGQPTLMARLPDEKVVFLKQGDLIGAERGRIIAITGKKVTIEENVATGDTKGGKRIKDIPLED